MTIRLHILALKVRAAVTKYRIRRMEAKIMAGIDKALRQQGLRRVA